MQTRIAQGRLSWWHCTRLVRGAQRGDLGVDGAVGRGIQAEGKHPQWVLLPKA